MRAEIEVMRAGGPMRRAEIGMMRTAGQMRRVEIAMMRSAGQMGRSELGMMRSVGRMGRAVARRPSVLAAAAPLPVEMPCFPGEMSHHTLGKAPLSGRLARRPAVGTAVSGGMSPIPYRASPTNTHAAQTCAGSPRSRERRRASVSAWSLRSPVPPGPPCR